MEPGSRGVEVSVVIPARNAESTLGVMLDSLARQRYSGRWEVVVVDNGSSDGTVALAESYRDRLPALRVVPAPERPVAGYARNVGVVAARGDHIVFLDGDDQVDEGYLEAMARALDEHEVVFARMDFTLLNPAWVRATRGGHQSSGPVEWWLGGDYFPFAYGGTIGVQRSVHERIGGYEDGVHIAADDIDYCWRLQQSGAKLRFVPEAVVHYRLRTSLRDLYRQARSYGESWSFLYTRYRPLGLPAAPRPLRRGLVGWVRAFRHLVLIHRRDRQARLAWDVGERVGMLRGGIRYRVLLL